MEKPAQTGGVRPAAASARIVEALRAHVSYLRDLGIFELYRRDDPADQAAIAEYVLQGVDQPTVEASVVPDARSAAAPSAQPLAQISGPRPARPTAPPPAQPPAQPEIYFEDPTIAPRKAPLQPVAFTPGAKIAPASRAKVLQLLREEIGDCTRCPLGFAGRHTIVFGDGDANASLLFVGEGPGADEDVQGVPFVGRAGQLLNNMITAMGLAREQVYIANIVKCRPPQNRVPEPVEALTCSQFLFRQIDIVRPEVIVALGSTAATYLLGGKSPLSALRGRVHSTPAHPGAKLIVTYHPAYLLRDPTQKKAAWSDLQMAMEELKGTR